jgi:hypothetical protein
MTRIDESGRLDLEQTIQQTYFGLRVGLVAIAIALPFILWLGGKWIYGIGLLDSMSAYYHTDMRNWFVGVLVAAAACLYLYKGLSDRENYLLNAAAIFAVGTAVNPSGWLPGWWFLSEKLSPHGISAVSFFVMIACVCWFCQGDSLRLKLVKDERIAQLKVKYATIGVVLVALPLSAVAVNAAFRRPPASSVFWIEATAIGVFAFYWATKSRELKEALERKVRNIRAAEARAGK